MCIIVIGKLKYHTCAAIPTTKIEFSVNFAINRLVLPMVDLMTLRSIVKDKIIRRMPVYQSRTKLFCNFLVRVVVLPSVPNKIKLQRLKSQKYFIML